MKEYFACNSSVLIGVAGSLLLDNVDWASAFYCVGIAGITWLIIWKFTLLNHTDIKEAKSNEIPTSGNKFLSVPWLSLLSHCPLWYVCNITFAILLGRSFLVGDLKSLGAKL